MTEDLQAKLAKLHDLHARGELPDDLYQAALRGRGGEPEPVNMRDSQGGLYKPTGPVKQQFGNRYYFRQAPSITSLPCDPADALACYLTRVIEENDRLQLQGIRSASGLVSIALEEVYITLTATVRDEEAWVEELAGLAPGEARRRTPSSQKIIQVTSGAAVLREDSQTVVV